MRLQPGLTHQTQLLTARSGCLCFADAYSCRPLEEVGGALDCFYCPVSCCCAAAAALLLNRVFLRLKCAALESRRCQRKQTQPEPHNQGRPSKENLKKKSSTWGEKFFSLWHANLRVALQHILNPLNCRPFLFSSTPLFLLN